MNVNYSKARNKILERLTNEELINEWNKINWKKAEKEVHKLHSRIARSMQNNRYNDVVRLQYLLTHSFIPLAVASFNSSHHLNIDFAGRGPSPDTKSAGNFFFFKK